MGWYKGDQAVVEEARSEDHVQLVLAGGSSKSYYKQVHAGQKAERRESNRKEEYDKPSWCV